MNSCPVCQKERDFNKAQCDCGFVYAPGCLMPLIIFTAFHVYVGFEFIKSEEIFLFSKEVGIVLTLLFVTITYGLVRRRLWSIYILRCSFMLIIVAHIMTMMSDLSGSFMQNMVSLVMHSFVVIYLLKPELKNYFTLNKNQSS